jgi:hypothetical protein
MGNLYKKRKFGYSVQEDTTIYFPNNLARTSEIRIWRSNRLFYEYYSWMLATRKPMRIAK